ncbi:alpha/beta hydrolase domain-containing protein 17b [Phtheirospermum japonicum]|uniref:Alpha/beta hydrolase domain-containing protein 17b n=1 Tax=Phtheirospermum japonicum TaxID=374723 RepID=A0A830D1X3_9LAMI|nr:alpha/beta hydrolase domain-containing protein 17b [Phtheirospermum japonicum]
MLNYSNVWSVTLYKSVNRLSPPTAVSGTEDDVVNWLHGTGLWKMAREPYEPLWIKGGGHCNLELYPDYIRHLCRFVQEMENITTQVRLRKIRLHKKSKSANRCYIAARVVRVGARNARAGAQYARVYALLSVLAGDI